jgi:hypothetical protein
VSAFGVLDAGGIHPSKFGGHHGAALRELERPPTVTALLRSLRMKRCLVNLRPLYQFLDPIEQTLVSESGRQALVMRDLAVEFDAPFTHCIPPFF